MLCARRRLVVRCTSAVPTVFIVWAVKLIVFTSRYLILRATSSYYYCINCSRRSVLLHACHTYISEIAVRSGIIKIEKLLLLLSLLVSEILRSRVQRNNHHYDPREGYKQNCCALPVLYHISCTRISYS